VNIINLFPGQVAVSVTLTSEAERNEKKKGKGKRKGTGNERERKIGCREDVIQSPRRGRRNPVNDSNIEFIGLDCHGLWALSSRPHTHHSEEPEAM
jgi:hypothetical protein